MERDGRGSRLTGLRRTRGGFDRPREGAGGRGGKEGSPRAARAEVGGEWGRRVWHGAGALYCSVLSYGDLEKG